MSARDRFLDGLRPATVTPRPNYFVSHHYSRKSGGRSACDVGKCYLCGGACLIPQVTLCAIPIRLLTCDHMVTYYSRMDDDDRVFKALADPTRRFLLDLLFARDGRTLSELDAELEMSRFGVMKHLKILEDAGLVVTQRSGREKLHYLNPVPIRLIHDRWIDKYNERRVSALAALKHDLEKGKDQSRG